MRQTTAIFAITSILMLLFLTTTSISEILFMDNFESDTIGQPAKNWTIGHDGKDDSKVIQDPKRAKNKVFSSPTERHDAKGAIYITGKGKDWTDYYVHWDMLYPKAFFMGIVFRFSGGESFYLLDRRENTSKLDFWKREKTNWNNFGSSKKLNLEPNKWFAFQLKVKGADFEVKMKDIENKTKFSELSKVLAGSNKNFTKGDFGNYGHVLLDNVVVSTKEEDASTPVDPNGNLVTNWGLIKRGHSF